MIINETVKIKAVATMMIPTDLEPLFGTLQREKVRERELEK